MYRWRYGWISYPVLLKLVPIQFPGHAGEADPDPYVEDGQLTTSAGTAAGIDCCLHLLRRDYVRRIANSVARCLVVSPHRQGGQAQFVEQPLPARTLASSSVRWLAGGLSRSGSSGRSSA